MATPNYTALLLSELRLAAVTAAEETLNETNLIKALTVNEELSQMGFTLTAEDVLRLSKSAELDTFPSLLRAAMPDVKAAPMYPDFPKQMMDITEAQFRFIQMLHYLSTYGMEQLTGEPVLQGWLPQLAATEKVEAPRVFLQAKTLELIAAEELYTLPVQRILSKCERMTDKELLLVQEAVPHLTAEALSMLDVPFKQNLLLVFQSIFRDAHLAREEKLAMLQGLCAHTGDVWKCVDYTLVHEGFHFRTSQKRLLVQLLERYPAADFISNLILSRKKAARTELMLRYLDFNQYAKSPAHLQAVADLRSGKLHSWEAQAKHLIDQNHPDALSFLAQHPGTMLRMLAWLIRKGYAAEDLLAHLQPHAAQLRPQTLVRLLTVFGERMTVPAVTVDFDEGRVQEAKAVYEICEVLLRGWLERTDTPLKGKKVWLEEGQFSLADSVIETNDKSDEGGYVRSGMAYRIPEDIRFLRFFVYWNDEERVDVDLHLGGKFLDGSPIFIGWSSDWKDQGLAFSGDITHSDAAEFIDIDMTAPIAHVTANINLYYGKPCFKEVEECFVGMMAVNQLDEQVKLYSPANCFFSHELTSTCRSLHYGFVDVQKRLLILTAKPYEGGYDAPADLTPTAFSVQNYLDMLFAAQGVTLAETREDADIVLVMEKAAKPEEISLFDQNFFF